jgi:hypothetical protein
VGAEANGYVVSWREPWNVGKSSSVVGGGRARVDLWNGMEKAGAVCKLCRS